MTQVDPAQQAGFAAQVPTSPTDPNQRVQKLYANGQQWLPLQTLYALVDSGLSDDEIVQSAESMRKAALGASVSAAIKPAYAQAQQGLNQKSAILSSTQAAQAHQALNTQQAQATKGDDGFKVFFDDPVLQKHPSAALALKQYLSGAIGPWPIQESHLSHIQQQLQVQGFGRDLKANGAWNSGWDSAQQEWKDHIYKSQLSGEGPGSISVGHALQALQALTPTSAWNALIGFAKALPDGARQVLSDIAESQHAQNQATRVIGTPDTSGQPLGATASKIDRALGGDLTPKKFQSTAGLRAMEDAFNIVMLSSMFGAAGRFAQAVGVERAAAGSVEASSALTEAAAYHGPGVVVKSLSSATPGNPLIPRVLLGGILGGGTATATGGSGRDIALATVGGAALGGLSTSEAFSNLPILGRTGPILDSLTDVDGLYYKARRLVAAPYQYSAVRLADTAFNQSLLLGGEARGLAQLQDYAGGDQSTNFSKSVENTHTMDSVNDAIRNRLHFTLLGQHISPSLDDLMFAFGGRGASALKAGGASHVGQAVDAVKESYSEFLGHAGVEAQIEHATGLSRSKLIQQAGGLQNYQDFWTSQLIQHAVSHAAENARNRDLLGAGLPAEEAVGSLDRLADLNAKSHAIYQDPEQVRAAVESLLPQYGGDELYRRIQRSITNDRLSPNGGLHGDIPSYLAAQKVAKEELLPEVGKYLPDAAHTNLNAHLINASEESGGLGIARVGTLTRQQAFRDVADFQARLDDLTTRASSNPATLESLLGHTPNLVHPTLDEGNTFDRELGDYLHSKFGVTAADMPHDRGEKLDAIKEFSSHLATDVQVHPDAPIELRQAFAKLHDLGYKPVSGTDIGWALHDSPVSDVLTGPLTFQRRAAGHLGLAPEIVDNKTISATYWDGIRNAAQTQVDAGKIQLAPYETVDSTLAYLQGEGVLPTSGSLKGALQRLFRTPEKLARQEGYYTDTGALDVQRAQDELNSALQLRDIPRKKVVQALTDPRQWAAAHPAAAGALNASAGESAVNEALDTSGLAQIPPMSRESAETFYRAIIKGYTAPPGWQLGAARIENLFRASMGFVGKGVQYRVPLGAAIGAGAGYAKGDDLQSAMIGGALGGALAGMGRDRLGWAMANLPNALTQFRNEFRFELSPFFSFRRIAKTNVKLAAEGITPVLDPLETMQKAGTLTNNRAILERAMPDLANPVADDADRYLRSQDVFGFYNHRNYEAYAAGEWAKQGLSDAEIHDKLIHTFEYGTKGQAGRSAFEHTTNFFFFPFSFDKTLYRNLGGYLLDKPAQRLLLTRGMAAYDEFNRTHMDGSNPLATSFYDKHVPLLTEVSQLNAFAHGVSLGEPGGINRPLLNLFLPQAWSSSPDNLSTLKRFIPVVKDFQRIWAEGADQKSILQSAGENMWRSLNGIPATYGNPIKSTLTHQEQLTEAFAMERNWAQSYGEYIDYNAQSKDPADKYKFPLSPEWGEYAGEPITKANIRKIVHMAFPAYDPNGAVIYATTQSRDFQQYLLDIKGTPLHDYVADFQKQTLALGKAMLKPTTSQADIAAATDNLRQAATYLANRDAKFYSLYNKNFRKIIGPLEAVKNA